MRPVRLTMQAFGPYAEREVIDFRDAVEAGLFGIYGQTGSGKSTIFSAMTFALFGEPAKTEQDAPSLRSDHADPGLQTEVEFVFDIGVRRFVILRRPEQRRPKQRGDGETRNLHEAFLFDATGITLDDIKDGQHGKIVAEKKVRDVDTAISELLGYGSEQFRQIVLLPQGRFEAFLAAKTKERLEILRDLFDVSLYRNLATKLKTDADAAERQVREEREVCARRLAADGFESTDALTAGVAAAEGCHIELLKREESARAALAAAQTALATAKETETRFRIDADARNTLAGLQASTPRVNELADRVVKAERARSLLDAEANVIAAELDIRNAEEKLKEAQKSAENAKERENAAAIALQKETERAGEIDDLRRTVEESDRHKDAIEKSAGIAKALEQAQAVERGAAKKYDDAQRRLTVLLADQREKSDALKAARQTEGRRQELMTLLAALKSSLAAAETFEKAEEDVRTAMAAVEKLTSEHETAVRRAEEARARFEEAEQSLSAQQALHLASKLAPAEPCPVCGATEHPAPATGAIEHAGRDQAFRDAKAAWQKAEDNLREAERKLTAEQSVLNERRDRLTDFNRPDDSAAALRDKALVEQKTLDNLDPRTDLAAADAEIERLGEEIKAVEKNRDSCRETLADLQKKTAAERVRLEAMLSSVPETLRKGEALSAARTKTFQELTNRQTVRDSVAKAATETREAALSAQKDLQAAEITLSTCRSRQDKANEVFKSRLVQAGLSQDDFRSLKPAITTIEEDRNAVEEHRRKLENAKDAANKAADAIQGQIRPDLLAVETKLHETEAELTEATNLRSGARHRLDHLMKLRDELAETLRKLDEAEVGSGALRNLAALFDGKNPQNLDLETFAIGAMFDQVLTAANLRLGPMTANRYRLERDLEGTGRGRRGLGIQVFDIFTGKARPTTTLSGGETFIAALALALGLADVVESASGKVRLDTIFIDEGFGSLDSENGSGTLDQVLQILSSLVSQNRAVGLISHVPLVQEAIPNGFYVRKELAGSRVEARGLV